MGLSSALASAVAGLRANQAALSITSSNVANANTPGYITQSVNQIEVASGGAGSSVLVTGVTRDLDQFIQGQLRTETGGAGFANQISNILGQLQSIYGTPGGTGTLETAYNNFTSAVQALQTNTTALSAQTTALSAAQALAQTINTTSQGIQTLRTNVNQDIGNSVAQVNTDLQQIAAINTKLQSLDPTDPSAATLKDQRDSAINDVSKYLDVRAVNSGVNGVNVFTTTGVQLVGDSQASQFNFNSAGTLSPTSLYNSDPAKSAVGALTVTLPNGASLDVIANKVINSGQIAADIQLRDQTLVQAQTQVDQLAATLSSSLSDQTTQGTAVAPSASLVGFNVDLSNVLPGNSINLTYTNNAGQQQQVKIVRVDDPSALPLKNAPGASPQVIGVNFTGGITSVVSQLNAALGQTHLQFANPSGNTLQIAANPADNVTVNSASTTTTVTSLVSGNPQLPFFTDAGSPYTGAITSAGSEMTGLAERIQVSPALLANPANVTVFSNSPPTAAGDTTRSDFIFKQLTSSTFTYSPQTGLGSTTVPFTGTISNYLQQFIGQQASAANSATQLQQGQSVVVSTLQQKFNATSEVNIDSELSNLISLQNSYAANAHVMSVVQNMMQTLLQAQR
ncbi:MAG TPA: flagellar hook-associated protein FlgK [Bradyrhizobium sp.]|uniref:flagellar hook-associated protein FlgK n=1 Tax=Bradyrhizobium sp. TaxID=376 RepID=UPI002D7EBB49|nr:flagellar hook-associated protein FlgK [Bradyrhizobium sp.]HET7888387.1 flagellar hook-associated protein FlgK [Bradyrhizobium sp.]